MYVVDRTLRFAAGAVLAAFVLVAIGMSAANAQQAQTPNAQQSQTPSVSSFLANPGQLLQQNPNGGPLLTSATQELALSDAATFKVLLGLLANANDAQKSALGRGLVQAAKLKVLTDQATAADWQLLILAVNDPTFKTAAIDALGDVQLGAVGGAGAGAGAAGNGLGGPGNGPTSGGPVQDIRSQSFGTQTFTFGTQGTQGTQGSLTAGGASLPLSQ